MNPIVSLVIVNYNCKPWLNRFFSSLRAQTILDRCETIIVDNSSQDGSAEICQRELKGWPNGHFLPTGGNYGYGGGCNFGARAARGKYLFFLNPDVWFEPDCLEALVRQAESSSARVFAAVELGYDVETLVPGTQNQLCPGFDIFGCSLPEPPKKPERPFAVGSFFFLDRGLFLKLGGFDQEFLVYGEEMDLSWRVHIAGESMELAEAAGVHHAAAGSTDNTGRMTEFRRFHANRNQLITILKNANGPLLLLAFSHLVLVGAESIAGAVLARKPSFIIASLFKPVADCWRLRGHIRQQRAAIRNYRRRGDWWTARHFLRPGFGHWGDIKRFLKWKITIDKPAGPPKTGNLPEDRDRLKVTP
jgi:N-acetylglucosaminyl-diphospho-decaprenol L-rhamnosyltransferase